MFNQIAMLQSNNFDTFDTLIFFQWPSQWRLNKHKYMQHPNRSIQTQDRYTAMWFLVLLNCDLMTIDRKYLWLACMYCIVIYAWHAFLILFCGLVINICTHQPSISLTSLIGMFKCGISWGWYNMLTALSNMRSCH